MDSSDPWTLRDESWRETDLRGFEVEALDGSIGKVDDASAEVDDGYLVVDSGPWIFGRKVLLPAGVVSTVDTESRTVAVDRTKAEIENAPEYDGGAFGDAHRDLFGEYYWRRPPREEAGVADRRSEEQRDRDDTVIQ